MNLLLAAVFIMPTILYVMNIVYLRENKRRLYEPDKKETTTLLIFNGFMLLVGLAVIAFYVFLSFLAMDSGAEFFGFIAMIAIGVGLFLYLTGINLYFSWQLIQLYHRS